MNDGSQYRLSDFLADLAKETALSFLMMSAPARIALVVGFLGFVLLEVLPIDILPPTPLAYLRVIFFVAFILGAVANARVVDEFYRSVHLHACAITLPIAAIFLYSASVFGIGLGRPTIAYITAIWFVGFVVAFARLRRA